MPKSYITKSIKGKQYRLHRLIMETELSRELSFNEIVHHKNGDKHDNRLENLEVMSRSEHMKEHKIGEEIREEHRQLLENAGIEKMYETLPMYKIAEVLGVSYPTIWKFVKLKGIRKRRQAKIKNTVCTLCDKQAKHVKAQMCSYHYFRHYDKFRRKK